MTAPIPEDGDFEPPLWEQSTMVNSSERLQKVLARAGFGSRRSCEILIVEGRVEVNGVVAVLGRRVDASTDVVSVDGVPLGIRPGLVYYLVNKPRGVVCTASDPHERSTILDLVPREPRVFSVGRLDKESEGLIIVTNDGDFAHSLTHPSKGVEKEYLVSVDSEGKPLPGNCVAHLRRGVELEDGVTAPASVSEIQPGVLRFIIHEGRNRQIRRMCEAVGYNVTRLVRVRIGPLRDTRLRPGSFRTMSPHEVRALMEAARLA